MADPQDRSSGSKRLEEILTPECRSLLRTLPFQKFYVYPYLFQYQGFWYAPHFLNGVLSTQTNFQANHSDILLVTCPKAGTTWLKALLFTLLNRSRHNPNSRDHPLLRDNPHDLVPFLEVDLYMKDPNPDQDLSNLAAPRLFSTHIPYRSLPISVKSSQCKIVYLCRNPKDTVISLWQFANNISSKFKGTVSLDEVFDLFCRGINPFGPFWDHTVEYWKASEEMPDKVLFLRYEEIMQQPCQQLRRVACFLGCPFSPEEESGGQVEEILRLCSFENLSKLEVNQSGRTSSGVKKVSYFRRGEVGDSANYLTPEMIHRLDRIMEEKLGGSNLGNNMTSSISIISSLL